MFGINDFSQFGQIVEGYTNYAFGKEEELSEKRMEICRKCPLYDEDTDKCSSKKCYNKKTGELSTVPDKGFICGCNCYMTKKSRVKNAKCILNNW